DQFPGCNICVAGAPAILDQIITPNRVTLLTNVDDLVTILSDQPATIEEYESWSDRCRVFRIVCGGNAGARGM
ncbi:MAG: hypothetical protein R3301_15405, partial [Saprospiraceae bacterium]|nr:hypothetical protein [Saprospiraceae bacterium]